MARPADDLHVREQRPATDRSLGELFSDLTQETSTLVRQEVQLATTEMSRKAAEVGKDVGFLAVGGFVAYAGFLAIIAAAIFLLANVIPTWVAALLVGLVVAGAGAFLIMRGLDNLKNTNLAPTESVAALKEPVR
jgi:drug/metabolite transporter (DMT)-like permease